MLIYQNRHPKYFAHPVFSYFDMFWSTDATQRRSEPARMSATHWRNFQPERDRSDEPSLCMISVPVFRFSTFPRIYAPRASPSSRQLHAKSSWIVIGTSLLKPYESMHRYHLFFCLLWHKQKLWKKTLTKRHRFSSRFSFRFVITMGVLDLSKHLRDGSTRKNKLSELKGERVGVDLSVWLRELYGRQDFAHDFHCLPPVDLSDTFATKVVGFTCFMKGILIVPKRIEAKNKI